MTQAQQILKTLQCGSTITPLDALNDFGCFRLSARIGELIKEGWPIEKKLISTGQGKRVAQYFMDKAQRG